MKPLEQVGKPEQIDNSPAPSRTAGRSELQEHFLERLTQLVALREEQLKSDASDKEALRLLSRALYSTYMDCVSVGVGNEANGLMEKSQVASS